MSNLGVNFGKRFKKDKAADSECLIYSRKEGGGKKRNSYFH